MEIGGQLVQVLNVESELARHLLHTQVLERAQFSDIVSGVVCYAILGKVCSRAD